MINREVWRSRFNTGPHLQILHPTSEIVTNAAACGAAGLIPPTTLPVVLRLVLWRLKGWQGVPVQAKSGHRRRPT